MPKGSEAIPFVAGRRLLPFDKLRTGVAVLLASNDKNSSLERNNALQGDYPKEGRGNGFSA